jgi:hypothetical protein
MILFVGRVGMAGFWGVSGTVNIPPRFFAVNQRNGYLVTGGSYAVFLKRVSAPWWSMGHLFTSTPELI